MPLPCRLVHLLARLGTPARSALQRALEVLLPGAPVVAELAARVLDAAQLPHVSQAEPLASAADRARIDQLLDVLAGELADLLARMAALEDRLEEARQVLEEALCCHAACGAASRAIDWLARQSDRLAEHHSQLLQVQGHPPAVVEQLLPLLARLAAVSDLAADLRATHARARHCLSPLLRRFQEGVRAAARGDLNQAQVVLGTLSNRMDLPAVSTALAAVEAARHRWHEAEQALRRAVRQRPTDADLAGLLERLVSAASDQSPPRTLLSAQGAGPLPLSEPAPAPVRVLLEVIAGPHRGERFEFDRHDSVVAGRAEGARVQLANDSSFSRHHFLLEVDPPHCYLRDLGSSNGTFVNGQKVGDCLLHDGDVISAGTTRIRFGLLLSGSEPVPGVFPSLAAPAEDQTRSRVRQQGARVLLPGSLAVPGYELSHPLGKGSLGVVYLARRLATGQLCALKLVQPESGATESAMRRFLQAFQATAELEHPHLVPLLEAGVVAGHFFFAAEYVETVNPREWLAPAGPEALWRGSCALICQVLEGLDHAHAAGLSHGDVKPANILVSCRDHVLQARLADFGLARSLAAAGLSGLIHEVRLPPPSLAPEQILNPLAAGPATDVYATGATLYFFLTNQAPFDFSWRKDPVTAILEDPPIALIRHNPSVPRALADLVHRALARDPSDRFPTARAMRQALLPHASPTIQRSGS